tara:strand:- start:2094 stop:2228 length:135 start_codon:yes stop_codon:yes gene_type:complete
MEFNRTRFEKKNNGHDIFLNGYWVGWVIGSVKNAKKELEIILKS